MPSVRITLHTQVATGVRSDRKDIASPKECYQLLCPHWERSHPQRTTQGDQTTPMHSHHPARLLVGSVSTERGPSSQSKRLRLPGSTLETEYQPCAPESISTVHHKKSSHRGAKRHSLAATAIDFGRPRFVFRQPHTHLSSKGLVSKGASLAEASRRYARPQLPSFRCSLSKFSAPTTTHSSQLGLVVFP